MKRIPIPPNTVFGDLIAISEERLSSGRWGVQCLCSCGKRCRPLKTNLTAGRSTRCPDCAKHYARMVSRVNGILDRCTNTVHPAWRKDKGLFISHLMQLDGWDDPDLQIDRIDNSLGYYPGNLHFASAKNSNRNRDVCMEKTEMEQHMRQKVVKSLNKEKLDAVSIENPAYPGTPDINCTAGWLELKWIKQWPPQNGPVRIRHFTPQQRCWLVRRWLADSRCWLVLQVEKTQDWLVFQGDDAAMVVGKDGSDKELLLKYACGKFHSSEEVARFIKDTRSASLNGF